MSEQVKDIDYSNIAVTLREIAKDSDKVSGKIIKQIQKAADDGGYYLEVKTTEDVYNYLDSSSKPKFIPPIIEKLWSLGFSLGASKKSKWYGDYSGPFNYYLKIYW